MKVKELFAVISGPRKWSISEMEEPVCGRDFWQKYRMMPEVWEADINDVHLIPKADYTLILVRLKGK